MNLGHGNCQVSDCLQRRAERLEALPQAARCIPIPEEEWELVAFPGKEQSMVEPLFRRTFLRSVGIQYALSILLSHLGNLIVVTKRRN